MLNHSSAIEREETPQSTNPNQNNTLKLNQTISRAIKRRAQSVIKDKSIDAQSRAVLRYGLETNDPWLAELVRRVDAGESLLDALDFSQDPQANSDDDSEHEKIEALADMICRAGDEPATKSAALLVLMATLERSPYPKALSNTAKHLAFAHCAELNLCGMVDAETGVLEAELFSGNAFAA